MTAVAALGVYRAYKHTVHDRVMTYLGLSRLDDEDDQFVTGSDDNEEDETASEVEVAG